MFLVLFLKKNELRSNSIISIDAFFEHIEKKGSGRYYNEWGDSNRMAGIAKLITK